jgi:hypothetical protein
MSGGMPAPITMRPIFLFLLLAGPLLAALPRFTSGETRTHLIELYSSEGCSSCPPAEAWLGGLRNEAGLWRDFVPVAFHVVYWDRLGWRDRFANRDFTARQYAYAKDWAAEGVYTPAFVLNGAEWRPGGKAPAASAEKVGVLAVDYFPDGICRVKFAGEGEVYVAILGGGITSPVRAGENAGRTLTHEFLALGLASASLERGSAEIKLPIPAVVGVGRHALAVWVTRPGHLVPVQATGGWLD